MISTGGLYIHTRSVSNWDPAEFKISQIQQNSLKITFPPRKLQQSKQNYTRPPGACTEKPGEVVQDTTCHIALFRTFWKLRSNSKYINLIVSTHFGKFFVLIYVLMSSLQDKTSGEQLKHIFTLFTRTLLHLRYRSGHMHTTHVISSPALSLTLRGSWLLPDTEAGRKSQV